MKFTPFFEPGSRTLLDFRVTIRSGDCPHCHLRGALIAHGYLSGHAATGHDQVTRGQRFFCSNRYSKLGCGGSFSVHWHNVIPYCSLRTDQLFELLEKCAAAASTHAAWQASRLIFSLRTACRWLARWRDLTSHVRARLGLVAAPPGKTDGHADPMTLRHLLVAFPHAACPIAAFQHDQQVAITGLPC